MVSDFFERNPIDELRSLIDRVALTWDEQESFGFDLSCKREKRCPPPKVAKEKPLSSYQVFKRRLESMVAEGMSDADIIAELGVNRQTIWRYKKRFKDGMK